MNMKRPILFAVAWGLAFVGWQSGMYSSDVSVERREGGVDDYLVVQSLPEGDAPVRMPVIVEVSTSSVMKVDHSVNNLLWFFTLGVVPFISSETEVCDMTVRTPIGEKSGTCTVEASWWGGWLPIFLPYPGVADERAANPELPNLVLAGKVRDRLVANLVSQFSKEEYASYVGRQNSQEMKAMRAKAAEAVRIQRVKKASEEKEAMRNKIVARIAERALEQIREAHKKGWRYTNPWRKEKTDWLASWASPRLPLGEADAQAGEALLSEFGMKYLPKAYANYEKRREELVELQQTFNENFPHPVKIKDADPEWGPFNKVLENFAKARAEAFLCHDVLCHYWLLWRLGVLTVEDLAAVDKPRLSVRLLPEDFNHIDLDRAIFEPMKGDVSDFSDKYAPESNRVHQKMERELTTLVSLLDEVSRQRAQMDDVRYSRAFAVAVGKVNDLVHELNTLSHCLRAWHMEHRTGQKSADDVARCDADMAKKMKPFLDSLPTYVRKRVLGPVVADGEFAAIPGRRYRLQRTEVTQLQWMLVMGTNPSRLYGLNFPVTDVSLDACREFIRRASKMDRRQYRLPTEREWEYACLAGSTSDWGKRADGECGPLDVMGWYRDNSGRGDRLRPHPVAFKKPNAWGLYDMHGNVWELCLSWSGVAVCCGGSFYNAENDCKASSRMKISGGQLTFCGGFRLATDAEVP